MTADDDRRHPAPQPTDALDEDGHERFLAVVHDRGQDLHDLLILPGAAIRRQRLDVRAGRSQGDIAIFDERVSGYRRRQTDTIFERRFVALASVPAALQVEEDPHVGGLLEVELLDLQLVLAGVLRQWMRLKESPGT